MKRFFIIFIMLIMPFSIIPVIIIHGDDSVFPHAFTVKINTQVFDPSTGMLFVGLQSDPTNPDFALSRVTRPIFDYTATFTPIGHASALSGKEIDLLTLSSQPNSAPFLPLVLDGEELVHAVTADGSIVKSSATLNDAAGASTSSIKALAASSSTVFAAVSPNGGNFLDADSGLAVLKIITDNTLLNALQIKDATTGLNGNLAAPLNNSSPAITAGTNATTAQNDTVSLYYDALFDRLYIAVQVQSGANATDVANSIVVGQLTSANILTFYSSAPESALNNGTNGIVITKGSGQYVTSFEPKIMHTSTGPDYLIVNGGPDEVVNVGNTVYALPLVNDPSAATVHGTLAKKDASLTQGVFTTPATNPGDLPLTSEPAAVVGAGALPTDPNNTIADIQVYGDTVYVALNQTPGLTTDAGLFSSQALFDATGKIARWTPWVSHLVPLNAFENSTLPGGATDDGGVKFFGIDARSSNIFITEGTTDQTAGVTNWNQGFTSVDMLQTLNNSTVAHGSYTVLDMPYHTNGFAGSTNYRYALFGANGEVTFIVTSQLNGVQEIPTADFSSSETLLHTPIAGTARVLEYSRRPTGTDTNYFFAGTPQGFFVFTDLAGNGFDVNTLAALNTAPFNTRSWQQISTIIGEPIAIKSSGNGNVYILTRTLTSDPLKPFTNTLYSVPFTNNSATMFAPGNIRIIAQTSTGIFQNIIQFFDIAIISTGSTVSPASKEQLVLATNQGLYYSQATQAAQNGIIDATDQTSANWTLDSTTATTMFYKIQSPNTPIQNTVWPQSVQDASGLQTFGNGSIHQLSGSGNSAGTAALFNNGFIPTHFNNNSQSPASLPTLIEHFWSDGNRRIIISKTNENPSNMNTLSSVPFTPTAPYNANNALNPIVIKGINHFYWISQIGATGQLTVGTDQGVIALS